MPRRGNRPVLLRFLNQHPSDKALGPSHGFSRRALCRTRTDDPFLTMEVLYQLS
jgi:hypothetical protein